MKKETREYQLELAGKKLDEKIFKKVVENVNDVAADERIHFIDEVESRSEEDFYADKNIIETGEQWEEMDYKIDSARKSHSVSNRDDGQQDEDLGSEY